MSTTASYKGQALTTVENETKTLLTAGKLMEDNIILTDVSRSDEDTLLQALRNAVTSVSDDTLTSIRSYGLAYMTALASVSFPELQTISAYAFYNDYNLLMDGWQFPKAKSIGNYAFRYCYGLTGDVVLPNTVTSIGQYSFANCDGMETFTAAGEISTLGTYTFNGASGHVMALRECHMPNLGTSIALNLNWGNATPTNACRHLEVCDIGKAKSIASSTFANCYKLQTLIMRRTGSVTKLANVSAFLDTPLRGRNGLTAKIYVPQALIDAYKAASVWTTINGYGYVEWLPIEGSPYEL
ncbi:MAG: leucine-rich repeat domain-containing protein [Oscillospiraceae bacterium]|nr:leucine-rich repeat domain-containing protein [Oscillospiraceae bacterium]